jgi:hypothetical protein
VAVSQVINDGMPVERGGASKIAGAQTWRHPPLSTACTRSRVRYPCPVIAALKPRGVWHYEMNTFSPFGSLFRFMSCSAFGAYVSAIPSALPLQHDKVRSVVLKDT